MRAAAGPNVATAGAPAELEVVPEAPVEVPLDVPLVPLDVAVVPLDAEPGAATALKSLPSTTLTSTPVRVESSISLGDGDTYAATVLAGIRAGGALSVAFPGALFRRAQWLLDEKESPLAGNSSAYRCGGSAGWLGARGTSLPASR